VSGSILDSKDMPHIWSSRKGSQIIPRLGNGKIRHIERSFCCIKVAYMRKNHYDHSKGLG
jgi:hypothetical protein